MAKLSDIPYDQVYIGMELISAIGTPGKVIEKCDTGYCWQGDYGSNGVRIQWDNGNESFEPILVYEKITLKND